MQFQVSVPLQFNMTAAEHTAAVKFITEHNNECQLPQRMQYSYTFTPTAIGTGVLVQCPCGIARDVTDHGSW